MRLFLLRSHLLTMRCSSLGHVEGPGAAAGRMALIEVASVPYLLCQLQDFKIQLLLL